MTAIAICVAGMIKLRTTVVWWLPSLVLIGVGGWWLVARPDASILTFGIALVVFGAILVYVSYTFRRMAKRDASE